MKYGPRDIFEEVGATLVMVATVLGFTSTHESWNVWLVGDSRRWTAGLLTVLAIVMFGLVTRHIGSTTAGVLGIVAAALAALAFWTASLTPLSLLAATIVLAWAIAVLRDLFVTRHAPIPT
jgi:hypothetical protein